MDSGRHTHIQFIADLETGVHLSVCGEGRWDPMHTCNIVAIHPSAESNMELLWKDEGLTVTICIKIRESCSLWV